MPRDYLAGDVVRYVYSQRILNESWVARYGVVLSVYADGSVLVRWSPEVRNLMTRRMAATSLRHVDDAEKAEAILAGHLSWLGAVNG